MSDAKKTQKYTNERCAKLRQALKDAIEEDGFAAIAEKTWQCYPDGDKRTINSVTHSIALIASGGRGKDDTTTALETMLAEREGRVVSIRKRGTRASLKEGDVEAASAGVRQNRMDHLRWAAAVKLDLPLDSSHGLDQDRIIQAFGFIDCYLPEPEFRQVVRERFRLVGIAVVS